MNLEKQLNQYASGLIWIARFCEEKDKRVITSFGTCVAVLEHPLSVNCPLNQFGAKILSRHSTYSEIIEGDYAEISLEQKPDHLSLHTPMHPRFCEVLKPLFEKEIKVKAFQFIDVPVLTMSLKEVHLKAFWKETIPFTIRIWV